MPSSRKSLASRRGNAPTPTAVKRGLEPRTKSSVSSQRAMQQSLSLPVVADPPPRVEPVALTGRKRLWLCIYLPSLPLEALYRHDDKEARAVFEEQQGIRRILQANGKARAAGVGTGLSVNAALSLIPGLGLEERSHSQEERLIKRLAAWAGRFTSFVAIDSRNVLLLEVAGSARLFDGIESIRRRIFRGLDAQGLTATLAVAPTPLASIWLAKSGRDVCIDDVSRLAGCLGRLSLDCLEWPEAVTESLRGMGAVCIGDCLRLPRQGFARRFGARFLNELDRAVGRLPDPRKSYHAPELFFTEAELDEEQNDSERLIAICRELLQKLERFLRTRQMQVQRVQFSFFHLRADATHLTLGRVQAGQDIDHWLDLLRIKFDRIVLPAPVIAIRLRGGQGQLSAMGTNGLQFAGPVRSRDTSIVCLVERLSARIGAAAVHGVAAVADHRPQSAWRPAPLLGEVPCCASVTAAGYWNEHEAPQSLHDIRRTGSLLLRRPLWVLETPEVLATHAGLPLYQGALTLLDGPERLESGWWDDDGIARDYFVARTDEGIDVWIYRDRRNDRNSAAWYLHGIFA